MFGEGGGGGGKAYTLIINSILAVFLFLAGILYFILFQNSDSSKLPSPMKRNKLLYIVK